MRKRERERGGGREGGRQREREREGGIQREKQRERERWGEEAGSVGE